MKLQLSFNSSDNDECNTTKKATKHFDSKGQSCKTTVLLVVKVTEITTMTQRNQQQTHRISVVCFPQTVCSKANAVLSKASVKRFD